MYSRVPNKNLMILVLAVAEEKCGSGFIYLQDSAISVRSGFDNASIQPKAIGRVRNYVG